MEQLTAEQLRSLAAFAWMKAQVEWYPVEHQDHYWRECEKMTAMADEAEKGEAGQHRD